MTEVPPPVDTVGDCFDVTAYGFNRYLLFGVPQYFPEAGHAAVAWRKSAMAPTGGRRRAGR